MLSHSEIHLHFINHIFTQIVIVSNFKKEMFSLVHVHSGLCSHLYIQYVACFPS